MYIDVSVTVSSPIVQSMDKAFQVLDYARIVESTAGELNQKQKDLIGGAADLIDRLLLQSDDMLGYTADLQILLCRGLRWHHEVRKTLRSIYSCVDHLSSEKSRKKADSQVNEFVCEMCEVLHSVKNGKAVDIDSYDEATGLCLLISESIWDHFISRHTEVSGE